MKQLLIRYALHNKFYVADSIFQTSFSRTDNDTVEISEYYRGAKTFTLSNKLREHSVQKIIEGVGVSTSHREYYRASEQTNFASAS